MSACTCQNPRARKHVAPGKIAWFWRSLARPSELVVSDGSRDLPTRVSNASQLICLRCLQRWRTSARYADQLPDPTAQELLDIAAGVKRDGHVERHRARAARVQQEAAPVPAHYQPIDYKMRAAGE